MTPLRERVQFGDDVLAQLIAVQDAQRSRADATDGQPDANDGEPDLLLDEHRENQRVIDAACAEVERGEAVMREHAAGLQRVMREARQQ